MMSYEEKIDARNDYDAQVLADNQFDRDVEYDIAMGEFDKAISLRIQDIMKAHHKVWFGVLGISTCKEPVTAYLLGKVRTYNHILSILERGEI